MSSFVMPNCVPRDGFFYSTLTLMIDSYDMQGFFLCLKIYNVYISLLIELQINIFKKKKGVN